MKAKTEKTLVIELNGEEVDLFIDLIGHLTGDLILKKMLLNEVHNEIATKLFNLIDVEY